MIMKHYAEEDVFGLGPKSLVMLNHTFQGEVKHSALLDATISAVTCWKSASSAMQKTEKATAKYVTGLVKSSDQWSDKEYLRD